jgi:hypothetical protein
LEENDDYNLHYAHTFYSLNPSAVPISAASDRVPVGYLQIPHHKSGVVAIPAGNFCIISYCPYTVAAVGALAVEPILVSQGVAGAFYGAVVPAAAVGTSMPADLSDVFGAPPLQTGVDNPFFTVLKGHMTVEIQRASAVTALPLVQAVGGADVQIMAAVQGEANLVAITDWLTALTNTIVPSVTGLNPAATTLAGFLDNLVVPKAATAALVYHQPGFDIKRGNHFRAGSAIPAFLNLITGFGVNPFCPCVIINNTTGGILTVQCRSRTVYGIPAPYIDNQVMQRFIVQEPVGVILDTELKRTLSHGGVGETVLGIEASLDLANKMALRAVGSHRRAPPAALAGSAMSHAVHTKLGASASVRGLHSAGQQDVPPAPDSQFIGRTIKIVKDLLNKVGSAESMKTNQMADLLYGEGAGSSYWNSLYGRALSMAAPIASFGVPRLMMRERPTGDDGGTYPMTEEL